MNQNLLRGSVAIVSFAVFGFLVWLIYLRPETTGAGAGDSLPLLNAVFNTLSAAALVTGYRAIRAGDRRRHVAAMLTALACSAAFLVGYVIHHSTAGDTPFHGQGAVRVVYFAILVSHVAVTAVTLPMILFTLAHAATGRFPQHKRIARRTLPLWLYVSVTGVLVFAFLRWWP
jgi:putative membrane protein